MMKTNKLKVQLKINWSISFPLSDWICAAEVCCSVASHCLCRLQLLIGIKTNMNKWLSGSWPWLFPEAKRKTGLFLWLGMLGFGSWLEPKPTFSKFRNVGLIWQCYKGFTYLSKIQLNFCTVHYIYKKRKNIYHLLFLFLSMVFAVIAPFTLC